MQPMPVITGHCLCGAVTITVAGKHDPRVGACHWPDVPAVVRWAVPVL